MPKLNNLRAVWAVVRFFKASYNFEGNTVDAYHFSFNQIATLKHNRHIFNFILPETAAFGKN